MGFAEARPIDVKISSLVNLLPQSVGGGLLQSFGDFCPSVRPYGKGRLRESTHLRITRHQGRVVTLSPAQWYNSVQLWLPFRALLVSCQCSDSVNRQWLSSA